MKIRAGFVSNSSSSSFSVVVEKEEFDRAYKEAHPYVQAVVDAAKPSNRTFLGYDVVVLGEYSTNGGSCWEWREVDYSIDRNGEIPEEYEEWPGEAFLSFAHSLDEAKKVSVNQDW